MIFFFTRKIIQINFEDLKYSQAKSQEMAALNSIKQRVFNETSNAARQKATSDMKKYGSTSTLSTIASSDNLSILSSNNNNNDTFNVNQSFKTVNTTFDCSMQLQNSNILNKNNTSRAVGNANNAKINENCNSTFTVKTFSKIVAQDINQHKVTNIFNIRIFLSGFDATRIFFVSRCAFNELKCSERRS
jgi:hypothetical protein